MDKQLLYSLQRGRDTSPYVQIYLEREKDLSVIQSARLSARSLTTQEPEELFLFFHFGFHLLLFIFRASLR